MIEHGLAHFYQSIWAKKMMTIFGHWQLNNWKDRWFWFSVSGEQLRLFSLQSSLRASGINGVIAKLDLHFMELSSWRKNIFWRWITCEREKKIFLGDHSRVPFLRLRHSLLFRCYAGTRQQSVVRECLNFFMWLVAIEYWVMVEAHCNKVHPLVITLSKECMLFQRVAEYAQFRSCIFLLALIHNKLTSFWHANFRRLLAKFDCQWFRIELLCLTVIQMHLELNWSIDVS